MIRKNIPTLDKLPKNETVNPLRNMTGKIGNLIYPLLAIFIMNFTVEISQKLLGHSWLVSTALTVALLLVCNRVIHDNVNHDVLLLLCLVGLVYHYYSFIWLIYLTL